jgi:methylglyoxal synthase
MFREAAISLPDYRNGEQFWPKYALLTHATELLLKAFVGNPRGNQPHNHDLQGWYRLALECGLPDATGVKDNIDLLNQLHRTHYTRYPQGGCSSIPEASAIADGTVDHLIFTITQWTNPR